jgi:hypothetical protein
MPHPDVIRRDAYLNFTAKTENLRVALHSFIEACEDPRLVDGASFGDDSEYHDGVSRDFVCAEMEKCFPLVDSFTNAMQRVYVSMKRTRNLSKKLVTIHALPNEMLQAIFLQGSSFESVPIQRSAPSISGSSESTFDKGHALLVFAEIVSQVCHLWRDVANNTARLWNRIDLRWNGNRTSRWLQRGSGVDLTVNAFISPIERDTISSDSVKALLPFLRGLRHINMMFDTLYGSPQTIERFAAWFSRIDAPITLHTLKLHCCLNDNPTKLLANIYACSNELRDLETFDLRAKCNIPSWRVIQGLTHLHLQDVKGITLSDLDMIIRGSPNLRHLLLAPTSVRVDGAFAPSSEKAHLPSLNFISFRGLESDFLLHFMKVSVVKSLRSFYVQFPPTNLTHTMECTADFLDRCSNSVRCLSMSFEHINGDTISAVDPDLPSQMLLAIPRVEELSFHGNQFSRKSFDVSTTLKCLAHGTDLPSYCPELTELHLHGVKCDAVQLALMCESRTRSSGSVRPLCTISADRMSWIPEKLEWDALCTLKGRIEETGTIVKAWSGRKSESVS